MKNLLKAFLTLVAMLVLSCSKDDNSSSSSSADDFSITLTSSHTSRYVNENFTLTVMKSDGTNVTSQATFTANNVAFAGNVFSTATAGNYTLKATFSGKTSQVQVTVNTVPTAITVSTTTPTVSIGDTIPFVVTGNNGSNITSSASTLIYVNGAAISGTSYLASAAGTLNVYAVHTTPSNAVLTSPTIQVTVNPAINFNKRVLIEDFTGTWCGYCPRVAYAISQVEAQTSDVDVVAIHRGNDPYNFSAGSTLENQISGFQGYPTGMLNRTTEWAYPEPNNVAQAVNLTAGANPRIGLALTTSVSGSTANVEVRVKYGKTFSNLKLVVYALEDNLIHDQTNYTSYYGGGSTIANFEHDNVVRGTLTNILGDDITGNMNYNDTFSRSFTYTIPNGVNANNLKFVAFVIDSTKKSLNSRTARNSVTQSFEVE